MTRLFNAALKYALFGLVWPIMFLVALAEEALQIGWVIGIAAVPFIALYVLVRFVKWAWSE